MSLWWLVVGWSGFFIICFGLSVLITTWGGAFWGIVVVLVRCLVLWWFCGGLIVSVLSGCCIVCGWVVGGELPGWLLLFLVLGFGLFGCWLCVFWVCGLLFVELRAVMLVALFLWALRFVCGWCANLVALGVAALIVALVVGLWLVPVVVWRVGWYLANLIFFRFDVCVLFVGFGIWLFGSATLCVWISCLVDLG